MGRAGRLDETEGRDWEPRALGDFSPSPNIRARPEDYPINDDNSPIKVANFDGSIGWLACYGERESCAGIERSAGKQSAMAEEKLDLGWRKRRLDSACALPHRRRTPGIRTAADAAAAIINFRSEGRTSLWVVA